MKTEMHNCPGFTKLNNTGRQMISLGMYLSPNNFTQSIYARRVHSSKREQQAQKPTGERYTAIPCQH